MSYTVRRTVAAVSLLALAAFGCVPTATPPEAAPSGEDSSTSEPGETAGEEAGRAAPGTERPSARADRGLADEVCGALAASFTYAFETLDTETEADRAAALVTEYSQRRAQIEVPQRHRDDIDRIDRGLELFVISGGFPIDGVELATADERDADGSPLDLWLHLEDEDFAEVLSTSPPCVEITSRQGPEAMFATGGQARELPAPSAELAAGFDAFEVLDELTRRAYVLAAAAMDEPSLHEPGFVEALFGPLPQVEVAELNRLDSDGLVTFTLDPTTDGADELAETAGGLTWCALLPANLFEGMLLLAPGGCDDAEVRAELAEQLQQAQDAVDDGWDDGGLDDVEDGSEAGQA